MVIISKKMIKAVPPIPTNRAAPSDPLQDNSQARAPTKAARPRATMTANTIRPALSPFDRLSAFLMLRTCSFSSFFLFLFFQ